jgi:ATP-binding cassette, subfamily C, bacterial exporter for protease/lipase
MTVPTIFRRSELTRTLWSFRREFAVVALLSMVANLLMLSPTLYMLQIYDRVLVSRSELTLIMLSVIIFFFFGVMAFADWVRSRLLVRAGVRFDEALNQRIFRASYRAELEQSGHNPGQALADLANIRQFLTGAGVIAIFDAPWTPIYIAVSFMLHPVLGWLSVFFVINLVILAFVGQRLSAKPAEATSKAEVEVNSYLFSKLRNSEVVESMGMLGSLRKRWADRQRRYVAQQSRSQALSQRMTALVKFARYTQQSLSLGAGALLAIHGEITVGSMIAANVLISRASQPIEVIVSSWTTFMSTRNAFRRIGRLLDAHPEQARGRRTDAPIGEVALQGLVATAPQREEPILKGLDAVFPAGQCTAIIGPSGSGKSTLARSLIGIWPFTDGRVLLDGHPLESWDRSALGPRIGYLPQDIELFEGTIAENIARFGALDSIHVIDAARHAGMHDMILRLPKGYDTPIGESGTFLSGGQRQRIALARALYGDPQLIVLDEPDSNLDEAGDGALLNAIRNLKERGRTVFIVSHRMNVLALADAVLLMDNGSIKAYGARESVLAKLKAAKPAPPERPGLAHMPA